MDYKSRLGITPSVASSFGQGGGYPMAAGTPATVGGGLNTSFGIQGNATGPALVLVLLVGFLVLDYVWTRGQQGGR